MTAITLANIQVPEGVQVKELKSYVSFTRKNKVACLVGKTLQLTSYLKEMKKSLKDQVREIDVEWAKKNGQCRVRAHAKVKNEADISRVLKMYFRK